MQPMVRMSKIDLARVMMTANQGSRTAKPSFSSGERVHSREEVDQQGSLSHLVLSPLHLGRFRGDHSQPQRFGNSRWANYFTEQWSD